MKKTRIIVMLIVLSIFSISTRVQAKTKKVEIGQKIKISNDNVKKYKVNNSNVKVSKDGTVEGLKLGDSKIEVTLSNNKKKYKEVSVVLPRHIEINGKILKLGNKKETVMKRFGKPDRIGASIFGDEVYVYNENLKELVFIYLKDSKVVGFHVDSISGFNYGGLTRKTKISSKKLKNFSPYPGYSHGSFAEIKYLGTNITLYFDFRGDANIAGLQVLDVLKVDPEPVLNNSTLREMELQISDIANSFRVSQGIEPLIFSPEIAKVARAHSEDMGKNNFFAHKNLQGLSPQDRLDQSGVIDKLITSEGNTFISGENLVAGANTGPYSIHVLLQSPGHRFNLLDDWYTHTGIGVAKVEGSKYGVYVTQQFAYERLPYPYYLYVEK